MSRPSNKHKSAPGLHALSFARDLFLLLASWRNYPRVNVFPERELRREFADVEQVMAIAERMNVDEWKAFEQRLREERPTREDQDFLTLVKALLERARKGERGIDLVLLSGKVTPATPPKRPRPMERHEPRRPKRPRGGDAK